MSDSLTYADRIEALDNVKKRVESCTTMTPQQCIESFTRTYSGWAGPGMPWINCEKKYIRVISTDRKREGTIPWTEFWQYVERCESGQLSLFEEVS